MKPVARFLFIALVLWPALGIGVVLGLGWAEPHGLVAMALVGLTAIFAGWAMLAGVFSVYREVNDQEEAELEAAVDKRIKDNAALLALDEEMAEWLRDRGVDA